MNKRLFGLVLTLALASAGSQESHTWANAPSRRRRRLFDYPIVPLVLALVLDALAESALRQSLILSQGSLTIFFTRPIADAISVGAILFFLMPLLSAGWRKFKCR